MSRKIIVICGPTASGKTELAISLAKKLNTEIISADSMNIYKGCDIGTAKPSKEEQDIVKHHMIDVASAVDEFSVSDYESKGLKIVEDLLDNDKTPIICGGTGFYINSLLFGLSYGKSPKNENIREKYNQMAKECGNEAVYDVLKSIDEETALKLHPNDVKRVIRAIEIFESSGVKKSEIIDDLVPRFEYKAYMINYDRQILYDRINKRVNLMLENGLIKEVENLVKNGVNKNSQSMQGIGYKEVLEYFDGDISIEELSEKIKQNTRRYAKRQITFFKRLNGLTFLEPQNCEVLVERIIKDL